MSEKLPCNVCGSSTENETYSERHWRILQARIGQAMTQAVCFDCLRELGESMVKFVEHSQKKQSSKPDLDVLASFVPTESKE